MSRCNQIGDLSPLGPCQCFSLWLFHKPLEQPLNPHSAGLQCRGWRSLTSKLCYVCGNQSLAHVLCKYSSWQNEVFKTRNGLYQHALASSFTQNDTQENSSAFNWNYAHSPRESFGAGSKHTPNSPTNILLGPSMLSHGYITCCFITTKLALLSPSPH